MIVKAKQKAHYLFSVFCRRQPAAPPSFDELLRSLLLLLLNIPSLHSSRPLFGKGKKPCNTPWYQQAAPLFALLLQHGWFSSRCQLNSKHLSTFNYHNLLEDRWNPEADRQNKTMWRSFTITTRKNSPLSFNDLLKLSVLHRHQLLSGRRCVVEKVSWAVQQKKHVRKDTRFSFFLFQKSIINRSFELGRKHNQKHKPDAEK